MTICTLSTTSRYSSNLSNRCINAALPRPEDVGVLNMDGRQDLGAVWGRLPKRTISTPKLFKPLEFVSKASYLRQKTVHVRSACFTPECRT